MPVTMTQHPLQKYILCLLYFLCLIGLLKICIHNLEFSKPKLNLPLMVHTETMPMRLRLVQFLTGWVTLPSKCTIILCGLHLQTKMTWQRYSLNLKTILDQHKCILLLVHVRWFVFLTVQMPK